jgi:hypothetical protein
VCVAARLTDRVTGAVLARLSGEWLRFPRDDTVEAVIEPIVRRRLHWAPLGRAARGPDSRYRRMDSALHRLASSGCSTDELAQVPGGAVPNWDAFLGPKTLTRRSWHARSPAHRDDPVPSCGEGALEGHFPATTGIA